MRVAAAAAGGTASAYWGRQAPTLSQRSVQRAAMYRAEYL